MRDMRIEIDAAFKEHPPNIEVLVGLYPVQMMQIRALLEIAENLE